MIEVHITEDDVTRERDLLGFWPYVPFETQWALAVRSILRRVGIRVRPPRFEPTLTTDDILPPCVITQWADNKSWHIKQWAPGEEGAPTSTAQPAAEPAPAEAGHRPPAPGQPAP